MSAARVSNPPQSQEPQPDGLACESNEMLPECCRKYPAVRISHALPGVVFCNISVSLLCSKHLESLSLPAW